MDNTSAGGAADDEQYLPVIDGKKGRSLSVTVSKPKKAKAMRSRDASHSGSAEVNRLDTIPLREASRQDAESGKGYGDTNFDTTKWRNIIIGSVGMVQQKVDQSTPHHVLHRELDDLKSIVYNSFEQLGKSLGRQIDAIRDEANQLTKAVISKEQHQMPFVKAQPRIPNEASISTIYQRSDFNDLPSPTGSMSPGKNMLDLKSANIEVLQKIQRYTQDASEMMRQKYLKNIWSFQDLH